MTTVSASSSMIGTMGHSEKDLSELGKLVAFTLYPHLKSDRVQLITRSRLDRNRFWRIAQPPPEIVQYVLVDPDSVTPITFMGWAKGSRFVNVGYQCQYPYQPPQRQPGVWRP